MKDDRTEPLPVAPALGIALDAARMPRRANLVEPRVLLVCALAVLLGFAAAFVAQALVALIALVTNLAFYGRVSADDVSPAGHALGAVTALIGPDAAMACTAAVETEIDKHYEEQRRILGDDEPELGATIAEFQAEEVEHRDLALQHGAENTFGYPVLSALIRAGCRAAIALSKRI